MRRLRGTLLLEGGPVTGVIEFDERITAIEVDGGSDASTANGAGAPYIAPGFIDVHVHGGGGADTMDGPDGVVTLAAAHLAHGTTSILPTTITNPWDDVIRALNGVREVMTAQRQDGELRALPQVLGAHLEGPFISPDRLGAQPPFALPASPELVEQTLATGVLRVVTLAPEIDGALAAARAFAGAGVRVSLGHTVASYEQVELVVEAVRDAGGEVGFTHLFNAMSPLGSREPGVVGAALASSEVYAELILDLHHVHKASFIAALAAKSGRLMLITDGIRATGTAAAETELGGAPVIVRDGAARLADGTLAGSVLTLDRAFKNAVGAGVPLHVAAQLTATVPAAYLGLEDRGALAVGKRADLLVLDGDLRPSEVYVGGVSAD